MTKITAIYTSSLERARETAAPIAKACGLALRVERDLTECDVGDWVGLSLKRLRRKGEWKLVQQHPSGFRFPGGESFTEVQLRMTAALGRLVERHAGGAVVAVSHADPIKTVIAQALGLHLDLFQRLAIAPASVTAIAYGPGTPMVLTMNSLNGDLAWLERP